MFCKNGLFLIVHKPEGAPVRILAVLIGLVFFGLAAPAQAKSWMDWRFTPSHPDFERPYYEDGKTPHNSQWENDDWNAQGWADDKGSKEAVLEGLMAANIIRDIDVDEDGGNSVLSVGSNFMRLGDLEKTRILKFVDYTYSVTQKSGGVIEIEYDNGRWLVRSTPVGIYSVYGLQLQ